jgi:hypothetical protein
MRSSAIAAPGFVLSQAVNAVKHVPASGEFDRIGDQVARNQRGLHALGAHGDAVGNGDGVELHRRTTGSANAFLNRPGEFTQTQVARHCFDPGVGNADNGFR